MSSLHRQYNDLFKLGTDKYAQALEAKSSKNKIKHATDAIEKFNRAIDLARIISEKGKIPYIYEHITLCHGIIGIAHLEVHEIPDAIQEFKNARESNKNTLHNEQTAIRELFILDNLLQIAINTKQLPVVEGISQDMLINVKKVMDFDKTLKYLERIKTSFILTKSVDSLNKTYHQMLKIAKYTNEKQQISKAEIYADFAYYNQYILKKSREARKYYELAREIFEEKQMKEKIDIIDKELAKINEKKENKLQETEKIKEKK